MMFTTMIARSHPGRLITPLAAPFTAIFLAGCVTTEPMIDTRGACVAANWQVVGLIDGRAGRNAGYIAVHRDNCAAYRVVPDLSAYEKGYVSGLLEYCTKERGYIEGEKGAKYLNACPAEIESAFLDGYASGYEVYRDQKEFRRSQMRESSLGGVETVDR